MKRVWLLAAAHVLLGAAWAQDTQDKILVSTKIDAGDCATFVVDGTRYSKYGIFTWPEGSRHFITFEQPAYLVGSPERCVAGQERTFSIIANRVDTEYTSGSYWEYRVNVLIRGVDPALMRCHSGLDNPPPQPWLQDDFGYIEVGGEVGGGGCIVRDTETWVPAGMILELRAHPPKNYAFKEWIVPQIAHPVDLPAVTLPVSAPGAIFAMFTPASRIFFATNPPGLNLLLDRTVVPTPFEADWGYQTKHVVAPAPGIQLDAAQNEWVFGSWSDGGAVQHEYVVGTEKMTYDLTANFLPAVRIGFRTQPEGLKLVVDGNDKLPGYNFAWGKGTTHTVVAPAEQAVNGHLYSFKSWSNGGPAEQTITVTGETDQGMVVQYETFGKLTLLSAPSGVSIQVDGAPCVTPCEIRRSTGKNVAISAPASIESGGSTYAFQGWSDRKPADRTWTAGSGAQELIANYNGRYRLTATADPAGAALFRFEPASPDGYYSADTEVTVTAEPKPGYRIRYWDGGVYGSGISGKVWMGQTRRLVAVLTNDSLGSGPAAVRNAAGETPDAVVAPGSLITIYGSDLAPYFEQGPASPLAQSIAGVTVLTADRMLPLVFVSPDRIDAQLPSDLAEGDYSVKVNWDNLAEIPAQMKVATNAPGLFSDEVDSQPFARALHQDGSKVTRENPAQRGETITLLGTGFGPYKNGAVDGFAVPEGVQMELADEVSIRAGEVTLKPESARAAVGQVGVTAIRLKIDDNLPLDSVVELAALVKGRQSNKVLLPLK